MDFATWWKGVEPIFQFGIAAAFAIILLSAMLWFGRRLVISHEVASSALAKIGVVLDQLSREHAEIRSDLKDIRMSMPKCHEHPIIDSNQ